MAGVSVQREHMRRGVSSPELGRKLHGVLAADALAECALLQRVGAGNGGFVRPFFDQLHNLMTKHACSFTAGMMISSGYSADEQKYFLWLEGRKDSRCNADPVTGAAKGLDLAAEEMKRQSGSDSPYYLPDAALPSGASPTLTRQVVGEAHIELCMAQKLQQHLDSAQVAFASGAELEQLHRVIRSPSASGGASVRGDYADDEHAGLELRASEHESAWVSGWLASVRALEWESGCGARQAEAFGRGLCAGDFATGGVDVSDDGAGAAQRGRAARDRGVHAGAGERSDRCTI